MTNDRGALIVFEGCDRAGKSTQSKRLFENLNKMNIQAASFTFPGKIKWFLRVHSITCLCPHPQAVITMIAFFKP